MGGRHAFVDESKRGDYVVVAAVVVPAELVSIRRELRAMLLPGQSALHFKAEQDGRRRQLLAGISALPVEAYVYISQTKNQVSGRKSCLQALVVDLVAEDAERLVLELSEGDLAADRRTLFEALRGQSRGPGLRYNHLKAPAEPMLWVADAVAWAWTHDGRWRAQVDRLVARVTQL